MECHLHVFHTPSRRGAPANEQFYLSHLWGCCGLRARDWVTLLLRCWGALSSHKQDCKWWAAWLRVLVCPVSSRGVQDTPVILDNMASLGDNRQELVPAITALYWVHTVSSSPHQTSGTNSQTIRRTHFTLNWMNHMDKFTIFWIGIYSKCNVTAVFRSIFMLEVISGLSSPLYEGCPKSIRLYFFPR